MLDIGLVYMVAIAMSIGLLLHWSPVPLERPIVAMLSWIGARNGWSYRRMGHVRKAHEPSEPGKAGVDGRSTDR